MVIKKKDESDWENAAAFFLFTVGKRVLCKVRSKRLKEASFDERFNPLSLLTNF